MLVLLAGMGCVCGLLVASLLSITGAVRGTKEYIYASERQAVTGAGETVCASERQAVTGAKETVGAQTTAADATVITPQWLFYQSQAGADCGEETKRYLDTLVNRWTKEKLTDDELGELVTEYLTGHQVAIATSGIQSQALCLFPSAQDLPDYVSMLSEGESYYDFIGVYTQGEYDEEGRLLCYYWEAGVIEG
jgi:hypothetical protein